MRVLSLGVLLISSFVYACGETARAGNGDAAGGAGESPEGGADNVAASGAGAVGGVGGVNAGGVAGRGGGGATNVGGSGGVVDSAGASGETFGEGGTGGDTPGGASGAGGAVEPQPQDPNVVFVTSETYVLSELGGLEGADNACRELATAAGLGGTFVAWLSTSSVDAKSRLGTASGWITTRGNPFADQPDELFNGSQVYYPIRYDERHVAVSGRVATGTSSLGVAAPQNCLDWTSKEGADSLVGGEPTAGAKLWTSDDDGLPCSGAYHLYCFQIDNRAKLYPTPSQGRTVFVSSEPFTLGPSGRLAADASCALDAAKADLGGTFVALLPTATESALARLTQPTRPWVRPDGMVVANSTEGLELEPLHVAVTELADGTHAGGLLVFGAEDVFEASALTCDDWTNPSAAVPAVVQGITGHTGSAWYAGQTGACSDSARVLCVER